MQDAQFVFVTEDARVMVMLMDGRLEDVTERCDLLPRSRALTNPNAHPSTNPKTPPCRPDGRHEKRPAVVCKFAA